MAKQLYKEYRVLDLPTSGLQKGDRYYLNVGANKYQTYIVSDSLQLTKEAGAEFIEKDTMAEMRALSSREIWALENGYYKGVKLNGYYAKNDTPAPIEYYLSDTSESDDGGSVIELGSIKLEHIFGNLIHVLYFGISQTLEDNTPNYNNIAAYLKVGQTIQFEYNKTYKGNFSITGKSINVDFNYCKLQPVVGNVGAFVIQGSLENSINVIGNPKWNDISFEAANVNGLNMGDLILMKDESVRPADGLIDQNKEVFKIRNIEGNIIHVEGTIRSTFMTGQVTFRKINKIDNVIINNAIFIDTEVNEFPLLWIRYTENVIVNNVKVFDFFGNGLRLDSCYGGNITNIYGIKPRAVASGQGYGVAINDSKNLYSNNIHGEATRHVVDYKCSYDCMLENVYETDGKSAPVVLAHNGFGGYISVNNVYTTANSYAVTVTNQGFSELNKEHQVLREYKITNVKHFWKDVDTTTMTLFGVLIRGNHSGLHIENIVANYSGNIDTTNLTTSSNVVRIEGDKKGSVYINNISSEAINSVVLLANATGTTTSLNYPTIINNLYATRCSRLAFIRGVGNISLEGLYSPTISDGVIRLDNLNGLNPNFININSEGLNHSLRTGSVNFIDPSSTITINSITGHYPEVSSTLGSTLAIAAGGTIPISKIYSSNKLLRLNSPANSSITLSTTTPIERGLFNGQKFTLDFRVVGILETGSITIPIGSETVLNDEPIIMKAGKTYSFVYYNGTWRLVSDNKMSSSVANAGGALPASFTTSSASTIETAVNDLNTLGSLFNEMRTYVGNTRTTLNSKLAADRASGQQAT